MPHVTRFFSTAPRGGISLVGMFSSPPAANARPLDVAYMSLPMMRVAPFSRACAAFETLGAAVLRTEGSRQPFRRS
jgi:hypothetical protein